MGLIILEALGAHEGSTEGERWQERSLQGPWLRRQVGAGREQASGPAPEQNCWASQAQRPGGSMAGGGDEMRPLAPGVCWPWVLPIQGLP